MRFSSMMSRDCLLVLLFCCCAWFGFVVLLVCVIAVESTSVCVLFGGWHCLFGCLCVVFLLSVVVIYILYDVFVLYVIVLVFVMCVVVVVLVMLVLGMRSVCCFVVLLLFAWFSCC